DLNDLCESAVEVAGKSLPAPQHRPRRLEVRNSQRKGFAGDVGHLLVFLARFAPERFGEPHRHWPQQALPHIGRRIVNRSTDMLVGLRRIGRYRFNPGLTPSSVADVEVWRRNILLYCVTLLPERREQL